MHFKEKVTRNLLTTALFMSLATVAYIWAGQQSEAAGLLKLDDVSVVREGKELYGIHCASCHGVNLEGQPNWRTRNADGKLPAPPHDETGHTWHHADELLIRITQLGTEALVGGGYRSDMIGFGEVLSDDEIIAILTYIKSTWPPEVQRQHDKINAAQQ